MKRFKLLLLAISLFSLNVGLAQETPTASFAQTVQASIPSDSTAFIALDSARLQAGDLDRLLDFVQLDLLLQSEPIWNTRAALMNYLSAAVLEGFYQQESWHKLAGYSTNWAQVQQWLGANSYLVVQPQVTSLWIQTRDDALAQAYVERLLASDPRHLQQQTRANARYWQFSGGLSGYYPGALFYQNTTSPDILAALLTPSGHLNSQLLAELPADTAFLVAWVRASNSKPTWEAGGSASINPDGLYLDGIIKADLPHLSPLEALTFIPNLPDDTLFAWESRNLAQQFNLLGEFLPNQIASIPEPIRAVVEHISGRYGLVVLPHAPLAVAETRLHFSPLVWFEATPQQQTEMKQLLYDLLNQELGQLRIMLDIQPEILPTGTWTRVHVNVLNYFRLDFLYGGTADYFLIGTAAAVKQWLDHQSHLTTWQPACLGQPTPQTVAVAYVNWQALVDAAWQSWSTFYEENWAIQRNYQIAYALSTSQPISCLSLTQTEGGMQAAVRP